MLSNKPCEMKDRTSRKSRALREILLVRMICERGRIVMWKEDNLHPVQGTKDNQFGYKRPNYDNNDARPIYKNGNKGSNSKRRQEKPEARNVRGRWTPCKENAKDGIALVQQCPKCHKSHLREYHLETICNCYNYGREGHIVRDSKSGPVKAAEPAPCRCPNARIYSLND